MPGAPDPLYVLARRVLLDALGAIEDQLDAVTLVGAQAVYVHTGSVPLAVPEFTTDGDVMLEPAVLRPSPLLDQALRGARFVPHADASRVGTWVATRDLDGRPVNVHVDLLVAEAIAGLGTRAARIPPHAPGTARRARGLEAALVDRGRHTIVALDPSDPRRFTVFVARPAALLVAKLHKVSERAADPDRAVDKDALDVYRLLRAASTEELARPLRRLLETELAAPVTREALDGLEGLFASARSAGCQMAARSAAPLEPADVLVASLVALATDLLGAVGRRARG